MAALRQAPTQACQAGATGTPRRRDASPPASTPTVPTAPALPFQPDLTLTRVHHSCNTIAGLASTTPDPSVPRFPGIFALLEDGANTTPCSRLEILANFPLGERPPLVVFLEAPELQIRVLWGAQFVTPSFAQPTPEDGKALTFSQYIRIGLLPETVVVKLEWLTLREFNVPQAADMGALMSHLSPGHPRLPPETPRPYTVSVSRASLAPLSLVHLMMVSPFFAPATACHMMHAKADAIGMTQQVAPFLYWSRAATVDPLQGSAALASVYLADATLAQR